MRWSTRSRHGWRGCRCAQSPAAPISCAPIAKRSAIRSSAIRNTIESPRMIRPVAIRCGPFRPGAGEGRKDPMRAAQANMRPPPVGRFYKAVEVREADGRHALLLDGRGARTPGRNPLAAMSRALMLEAAAEWERQHETIDPANMPLTRLLNSAIDGVAHTMAETRADILSYAGSDLLCYRAEEPDTLVARQAHAFDPVLRWAAESLGARL